MDPRELLALARHLAAGGVEGRRGRPRQVHLKRAVSATYYAMFHALAASCANALAGPGQPAWRQTYRSLEHGYARSQCENAAAMAGFSPEVRQFGRLFSELQLLRQSADYDPGASFSRDDVMRFIQEAGQSCEELAATTRQELRTFALHVLLRQRR